MSSPADPLPPGWLYREPRGGGARPWLPPRRAWFVLTRDSLDQFSSSGKGARRLGSLVLTSLCSVIGPERRPKETGETSWGLFYLPGQQPQPALIALRGFSFLARSVVSNRVWPEAQHPALLSAAGRGRALGGSPARSDRLQGATGDPHPAAAQGHSGAREGTPSRKRRVVNPAAFWIHREPPSPSL